MNFSKAVKTCFRKYVTFSGRASRAEYWYFWLFYLMAAVALVVVNSAVFGPETIVTEETVFASDGTTRVERGIQNQYNGGLAGDILTLVVFLPGMAVAWRRLHDVGRSGWWAMAPFAISVTTGLVVMVSSIGWSAMVSALANTGHVTLQGGPGAFLVLMVVFSSFFLLLIWLCTKSQPSSNQYGPNPYEVAQ